MANPILTTPPSSSSTHSSTSTAAPVVKRWKMAALHRDGHWQHPLLPGLPDHIALLCLARVPPSLLFSVCHSWRRVIYAPSFPPFLSLYALLSPSIPSPPSSSLASPSPSLSPLHSDHDDHLSKIEFFSYDPISTRWHALPPPAPDAPLHLLLRHPSFLSRKFPIQTVSVAGNLVLLAATGRNFFPAISHPLIFNPITRKWAFGPPFTTPRRWCAAGVLGGSVYVASGIGSQFRTDVARSVEKWDLYTTDDDDDDKKSVKLVNEECTSWEWRKLNGLKDVRFCRDAIEAVGWRGKLCMVNVKGHTSKQGVVYDVVGDTWRDMPEGMIGGWRGPVAAMDEETIYVVDEVKGLLARYDEGSDSWFDIMESDRLRGAQHISAAAGRVCVVCGGDAGIAVVDVASVPARLWVVEAPPGMQAVAVHVLPRMIRDAAEDL